MTFKLADLLRRDRPTPPDPPPKTFCPRTGKVRYRTRSDADGELASLRARDPHPERLRKYRCWSCGDFHLGHTDY